MKAYICVHCQIFTTASNVKRQNVNVMLVILQKNSAIFISDSTTSGLKVRLPSQNTRKQLFENELKELATK